MNSKSNLPDRLISVLVHREPAIISRLTGLLHGRGFATLGISVGNAKEREMLQLTVHVKGDDRCIDQVQKQIGKITETVRVAAIDPQHHVRREVALIKLRCNAGARDRLQRLAAEFQGHVVDSGRDGIIIELTDDSPAIERFIERLDAGAIIEIARSGIVAMDATGKKARVQSLVRK